MTSLNLGILTFIPREMPQRRVVERLVEAIEARGHRVVMAHHGEYHPEIRKEATGATEISCGKPAALYDSHGRALSENSDISLDECHAAFIRYDGVHASDAEFYLTTHLDNRIPLINRPRATRTLGNKFTTYLQMARHGLPCPRTALLRRLDEIDGIVERLGGFPVVMKRVRGACGRAVAIAESMRSLRSMIELAWTLDRNEPILLQEFIDGIGQKGGPEDLRLWVVGGEVLGAARRIPPEGEFRANAALGAVWEPVEPTLDEKRIALRAMAALGADYLGVDMIRVVSVGDPDADSGTVIGGNAPLLLDLNSNAEFKEFEESTGIDVADALVRHAERRVEQWRRAGKYPDDRFGSPAAVSQGGEVLGPKIVGKRSRDASLKTHREALEWLYGLPRFNSLLAPERVRFYLEKLGRPHAGARSVVIAGANGKGTTAAMLERICREHGWRTGLFTSPHLLDFEERIRVDGRMIEPEETLALARRVRALLEHFQVDSAWAPPCGFDVFVLMAALKFEEKAVDVAIYETGIGGECDATRGLDAPLIGLASIDLEHTELLGDTRRKILGEKLGLVQAGSTLVMQENPPEPRYSEVGPDLNDLASEVCKRRGAQYRTSRAWTPSSKGAMQSPFAGVNAGLAIGLAEEIAKAAEETIDSDVLARGVEQAVWPGRLTVLGGDCGEGGEREPLLLIDAAHTPMAIERLVGFLKDPQSPYVRMAKNASSSPGDKPPLTLLLATAYGKNTPKIVRPLAELADQIVVTEASYRSATVAELARLVRDIDQGVKVAGVEADVAKALDIAKDCARRDGGWVLAAGGLFLTADILRIEGVSLKQL